MTSMDESVSSLVGENMPISSVLLSMGVKVKNQNCGARLKAALGNFDECYLDAMDFLTQILPIAKQHFGKHDALLLPKTPSMKRARKHLYVKDPPNDMKEQSSLSPEDIKSAQTNPATEPVELQLAKKPVKRVTRSSAMGIAKERTTRQTKGQNKKASIQSVSDKLQNAFEETESEETVKEIKSEGSVCVKNEPSVIGNEKEEPVAQKNLKRSSSSSPVLKRRSKKSKSGDKLPVAVESSTDCEQQPATCLSESNHEPEMGCGESAGRKSEIVVVVENIGDHAVQRTSVEGEKNDPGIMEFGTGVNMEINLCPGEGQNLCNSDAKPCQDNVEEINEQKQDELNVEKTELGKTSFVLSPVASNIHVDDEATDCNSNDVVPTECSNECHNGVVQESIITASPDEKTGLPTNNAVDNVPNEDVLQETVVFPEETSAEETTHARTQENGESSGNDIQPATNPRPWVRRSTRSSRRISRASISTQNKRRSSRRLSSQARRRSSLKNLPAAKKVDKIVPAERKCSSPDSSTGCGISELDKLTAAISEHSSIESEDEPQVKITGPSSSTPDFQNTPKRTLRSTTRMSLNTNHDKNSEGSSSDAAVPSVGKVAGIVTEINRNTKLFEGQTSIAGTPNGQRRIKRIRSTIKRSATRPSNNINGSVQSFIKRPTTKKLDADEIVRLKKLELQRKEEKQKERKEQAELCRKNWAEEQKRKREERQKRVMEAKAAREKEEREKKQRQLEEKKQLMHVSEQAKKKKEQEEETKKKLRDQRKKEADTRRLKENEERLKRLHEKEEEDRHYWEMQKRKQVHDEQERRQRVLEEKRLQEQKQRDRQRDKEEERQRKLREMKEKEQKRLAEKVNESELRSLAEKKNMEEKEKEKKEQEEREKKRIALLIQEKVDQDKKIREEKRQKEEKERKEREEEERKHREAHKLNQSSSSSASVANKSLNQVKSVDSYQMTPPPAQTRKPSTNENYDISDIRSDESTDDEECPRKKVPSWAQGAALKAALLNQIVPRRLFEAETGPYYPPDLDKIFHKKRKRFYQRTSSAHWDTPPIKRDVLL